MLKTILEREVKQVEVSESRLGGSAYLSPKEAKEMLAQVNKKERWSLLSYLIDNGMLEPREYTLEEIGDIMGTSKQYIKNIQDKALSKLKDLLDPEDFANLLNKE